MSVSWNPIDDDEIECKRAFEALGRSADRVVLPSTEPGQPNRFVLRSKSYFGKSRSTRFSTISSINLTSLDE